ncbi:MAG: hypothetical protein GIX03_15500 [Candidatus Eremiobacteraeota bacterium]|nr:hypothetical protein [Candidatus Eremiobacteraeota bacterium]MBC5804369.1 hypothetical protein [Candidatus Eremiobacteraeota bacterium]MBC5820557.1 hypothetical protein [Candidatus Eremiobacteraeota bacterium]
MPEGNSDRAALAGLHAEVGRFYLRDRAVVRAQTMLANALENGGDLDAGTVRAYLREVTRYFAGFERESRGHLKNVEARLERIAQLQFNLTAERGVAARRVQATQGVLARLRELGGR